MNFKKFVSGVSAFTIAASAFASMAVTANADGEPLSGSYDVGTKTFSWALNADKNGSTWTTTDDDRYADLKLVTDESNKYNYISDSGFFLFRPSVNGQNTNVQGYVQITPTVDGTFSFDATINWTSGNSYQTDIRLSTEGTVYNGSNDSTLKSGKPLSGSPVDLVVSADLKAGTTYYIFTQTYYQQRNESYFKNFKFVTDELVEDSSATEEPTATPAPVAAESLIVNYVSGETVLGSAFVDVTDKYLGDTQSYSYPKYIIKDGGLYTAKNTSYTASTALNDVENSVDVIYEASTAAEPYFAEGETLYGTKTTTASSALSGGIGARVTTEGAEAATIANAGEYEITVAAFCRNTRNDSMYAIYKNAVSAENLLATYNAKGASQNGPAVSNTKVMLNAGDKIIIAGNAGETSIDYVLATKVGEYVEPITAGIQVTTTKDSDSYNTLVLNITNADNKEGTATYTFDGAVTITKGAAVIYKITDIPEAYTITGSSVSYVD